MKIYSHRGRGINFYQEQIQGIFRENNYFAIETTIQAGYSCEIDVWMINGYLKLGHDEPKYDIDSFKLEKLGWDNLLIHCKNAGALEYFNRYKPKTHYFWHEYDKYTISSRGIPICYPGTTLIHNCIYVGDPPPSQLESCYGIITDFPTLYKGTV